jgi:DNA-binding transcriptional ArsR family regulator
MSARRRAALSETAELRALAHPTRLRLLGLLRMHGPQTAAQLGVPLGEAPGTVSYHLRALAAVGLIEEAEAQSDDRRARWWRAAHDSTSWDPAELFDDEERAEAGAALQRVIGGVYAQRWTEYVDTAAALPREWVAAGLSADTLLRLTAGELAELRDETTALLERWRDRSDEREAPDGAELVAVVAQAYRVPR